MRAGMTRRATFVAQHKNSLMSFDLEADCVHQALSGWQACPAGAR
jgi:hypothetical protein